MECGGDCPCFSVGASAVCREASALMSAHPYSPPAMRGFQGIVFIMVIASVVIMLATPYYYLAFAPALLVILILVLGKDPSPAYYLVVFLIPFDAYRGLGEGDYQFLTISKFAGILLLGVLFVHFVIDKRTLANLRSGLWIWLVFYFMAAFVSSLASDYGRESLDNMTQLATAIVFFGLTLYFTANRRSFLKTLPVVIVTGISIGSALSIIGYVFDIPLFIVHTEAETLKRGVGIGNDPNIFSAVVIFGLPLLAYYYFTAENKVWKAAVIVLFALNVSSVVSTFSRGGALIMLLVLSLLFMEHMKRFKPRQLGFFVGLGAAVIVLIMLVVPSSYWSRQKSVAEPGDESIVRRTSYLYAGWDSFKENPVIGTGPGTFRYVFAASPYVAYDTDKKEDYRRYAHNSYIEVLVGAGLVGFVFFFAPLILAFKGFITARRRFRDNGDRDMYSATSAYMFCFFSMAVYFLIVSIQYHKFFWLTLGLSQAALILSGEATAPAPVNHGASRK
ncbi:MAG: O-antigen ligase family protein [Deltaproteobacteria bacterium]|nr:O-antigen ligase family protein [Deltaproteobacteria bacterium]